MKGETYEIGEDNCLEKRATISVLEFAYTFAMNLYVECNQIGITEVSDFLFSSQWITSVGCHGYQRHPETVIYTGDYGLSAESFDRREQSSISAFENWKKHVCALGKGYSDYNLNKRCECQTKHHWCRDNNYTTCEDLTQCYCSCRYCDDEDGDHSKCKYKHEFCFKEWRFDQHVRLLEY